MWQEILKALPVYFSSMLKFIFGPTSGYLSKLNMWTTIMATVAGMMTVVVAFTYFGEWLRHKIIKRFFSNKRKFTKRSRRFVKIWRSYGMLGVAFLTPLLFTPIGGSLLAVSFGGDKLRLIFYMFLSATFWAIVLSVLVYFFGGQLFPDYIPERPN